MAKSGDWSAALAKCAKLRKQLAFPLGPLPNPRVQVLPEAYPAARASYPKYETP